MLKAQGGNYNSSSFDHTPPARVSRVDESRVRRMRKRRPPKVDWDRVYGPHPPNPPLPSGRGGDNDNGGGMPLWMEARTLLEEGYSEEKAATELRLRYGRQVECDPDEMMDAINSRGGEVMPRTDWKTPGAYGDDSETRPLWEIAAEMHDEHDMSWEQVADALEAEYGVDVHCVTVADRVAHYQAKAGHPRGDDDRIDWQTPGVYDERALVAIAAAIYDAGEDRTWPEVAEILRERYEVDANAPVARRVVSKWRRRNGGDGNGAPPPAPPPSAANDAAGAGEGRTADGAGHGEGCECADCENMRAHIAEWEDEDPFGDGGEDEEGPETAADGDGDRQECLSYETADDGGRGSASDLGEELQGLADVQREAMVLFARKNSDYGAAYRTHGAIGVLVRIGDKLLRCQQIGRDEIRCVADERLRDTLVDLHNYAAMAIMEIDRDREAFEGDEVGPADMSWGPGGVGVASGTEG